MRRFILGVLVAGAPTLCAATDGFEQKLEEGGPFPWAALLYTAVAVAGIAVVAFKNARRTHLD